MASKKRGLGRGLDALFADAAPVLEEENTAVIDEVFEKERIRGTGCITSISMILNRTQISRERNSM